MKKIILSLIAFMSVANIGYAQELFNKPEDLQNFQQNFYEAPIVPLPTVNTVDSSNSSMFSSNDNAGKKNEIKGMPLFKKMRIRLTNIYREKNYNEALKLIEKEKQDAIKDENDYQKDLNVTKKLYNQPDEKIEKVSDKTLKSDKTTDKTKKKIKFWHKKANKDETSAEFVKPGITPLALPKDENSAGVSEETSATKMQPIELSGGVKQMDSPNDATLDADKVEYLKDLYSIVATGSPILVFPAQEITLKADKMVYNRASNVLKAYGNVNLLKDGENINGDFLQVDMNEESVFMTDINTKKNNLRITARDGTSKGDKLILNKGKLLSEDHYILRLATKMIGGNNFNSMLIDDEDRSSISDTIGTTAIGIKAKDVYINAKKEHDTMTFKKAALYYGDKKIVTLPSFTVHTDKKQNYMEADYPEFGSRSKMGMFIGPGFVFDVPYGATLKVMPMLNYDDKIGFGGAAKYRSATNHTEVLYGTANEVFIARGKQQLDDKLFLQYGSNSYMDDGFNGMRMAKYLAEIVYKDSSVIKDTFKKDMPLTFTQRAGMGYMHDNDQNKYGEKFASGNIGTTRFKYMATIDQSLYKYLNKEKLISVDLGYALQGSAAVYGTGDTQFIGKMGPRIRTQYKYWLQDIGYFMSAYQDNTPMPIYDAYRYGHSNVYIREALRVNKYITLAWSGSVTLTDDAPNNKLFQENAFIIALGPDDFKFNLGYDVVREQTYFSVCIAMDTKGSSLEYEKMEIKNPDRLANSEKKEEKLKTFETVNPDATKSTAKMIYAEVIDLEDPNKEQI